MVRLPFSTRRLREATQIERHWSGLRGQGPAQDDGLDPTLAGVSERLARNADSLLPPIGAEDRVWQRVVGQAAPVGDRRDWFKPAGSNHRRQAADLGRRTEPASPIPMPSS